METQKQYTPEKNKKLGSAVLWLLVFPEEAARISPCIALGQESYPKNINIDIRTLKIPQQQKNVALAKWQLGHKR